MRRISIVGSTAAGKSTLAARLAQRLHVPHIELDSLHWEPGWTEAPLEVLRQRVTQAVAADAWVVDGNYAMLRGIVWPRIDTLVWLDYSLPCVLGRVLRRTARRTICGEPCCNGNRETLRRALSRDSVIWWVLTTHRQRRLEYTRLLPELSARGINSVRLQSPRAADRWLASVRAGP